MKIYLKDNVLEAALKRMRWIFDEFEHLHVSISGGKDSTVVLNLALEVAEERGRLPLKVLMIDQEAEWPSVIEHVASVMADPRVEPRWLQVPLQMENATSSTSRFLHCWEEGGEWLREKSPIAIKENIYGTETFYDLFREFHRVEYGDKPSASIGGVRCEESPGRTRGLTTQATYKHVTWGKKQSDKRGHYTFYPIYDWSYTDVWKAIHEHGWPYARHYDDLYRYGVRPWDMRVSNVHHETAVKNLYFAQEIAPEFWVKLTKRLSGVNTAGQLTKDMFNRGELPPMFANWREYIDHLLKHLVDDDWRPAYIKTFDGYEKRWDLGYYSLPKSRFYVCAVNTILANDHTFCKLKSLSASCQINKAKREARDAA